MKDNSRRPLAGARESHKREHGTLAWEWGGQGHPFREKNRKKAEQAFMVSVSLVLESVC